MGEDRVTWLTDFFNVIFKTAKMHRNGDIIQSSHCTRIKDMPKTAIIIGALSYLATQ